MNKNITNKKLNIKKTFNNLICEEFCYSKESNENQIMDFPSQVFELQNFNYIWKKLSKRAM